MRSVFALADVELRARHWKT